MSKLGTKEIKATLGGTQTENAIVAEYKGFGVDICKYIQQYNQTKSDGSSGMQCKNSDNGYYILSQGSRFTTINSESIWQDLTSKLRLK